MVRRPTVAPVAPGESEPSNVVLPEVESSPLSYLGPTPILVTLFKRTWTVPALTAVPWLEIIWTDPFDPDAIFPGLIDDQNLHDLIVDGLIDGSLDPDELFDIAMEVLTEAAGYDWWFALKLATAVRVNWARLGGHLVLAGVDPARVTLGAWLSACLALVSEHTEPKGFATFLNELTTPPEGYGPSPEEMLQISESEFLSMQSGPF